MTDDELSLKERSLLQQWSLIRFEIRRRKGWPEYEAAKNSALESIIIKAD